MRPLRVAATACTAPGWTTPSTSTPSVVCSIRSRSAGSATAVAELQATTSSLIRRASSSSAISSENASSSAAVRSPYGKRAASAAYTKSSCGSCTSSSCSTVSPPTPESKTPTGRRRSSSGAFGTPASLPRRSAAAADSVDGGLQALHHRLGDPRIRERAARLDHPGDQHRHQQHEADVLDRALPALGRPRGVRPAHQLVDHPDPCRFAVPACRGAANESPAARRTDLHAFVTNACHVRAVRALVVTNMYPTPERPEYGRFVLDQVEALRRRGDVEVEVFSFPPGLRSYPAAARELRRRHRRGEFDVVHAHFGLTAWPAVLARLGPVVVTLHGNDLFHPRSNRITRAVLPFTALPAAVSREFSENVPGAGTRRRVAVLPVGIDLTRFRPIPRREARERLGLDPDGPYLLFPHDPARPLKRFDRAREAAGDVPLLTLGDVDPAEVPYWINAANAVLVPSQDEGLGLSVIEALACGVPAFGTPVGIHPVALHVIEGAFCEEWDAARWRAALRPVVEAADPRVDGRARAELFSADRMAERVVEAWHEIAAPDGRPRRRAKHPAYTRRFERIGDRARDRP